MIATVQFPHYYLQVDNDLTEQAGAGSQHSDRISVTNNPQMHHRVTAYSLLAADDLTYKLDVTGTPQPGGVTYGGHEGTKKQPAKTPWTVTVWVLPGMKRRRVDPEVNTVNAPPAQVKKTPSGITCDATLIERSRGGKTVPFTDPNRWPLTGSSRLTFDIVQ